MNTAHGTIIQLLLTGEYTDFKVNYASGTFMVSLKVPWGCYASGVASSYERACEGALISAGRSPVESIRVSPKFFGWKGDAGDKLEKLLEEREGKAKLKDAKGISVRSNKTPRKSKKRR